MSPLILTLITTFMFVFASKRMNNRLVSMVQENAFNYDEDIINIEDRPTVPHDKWNGYVNAGRLSKTDPNSSFEDSNQNGNLISLQPMLSKRKPRTSACDCRLTNKIVDLGYEHYPRYILSAVCQNETRSMAEPSFSRICWHGSYCKAVEYKIRVLAPRIAFDDIEKDLLATYLPEELRPTWKLRTVVIAAGCFCAHKPTHRYGKYSEIQFYVTGKIRLPVYEDVMA